MPGPPPPRSAGRPSSTASPAFVATGRAARGSLHPRRRVPRLLPGAPRRQGRPCGRGRALRHPSARPVVGELARAGRRPGAGEDRRLLAAAARLVLARRVRPWRTRSWAASPGASPAAGVSSGWEPALTASLLDIVLRQGTAGLALLAARGPRRRGRPGRRRAGRPRRAHGPRPGDPRRRARRRRASTTTPTGAVSTRASTGRPRPVPPGTSARSSPRPSGSAPPSTSWTTRGGAARSRSRRPTAGRPSSSASARCRTP